MAFKPRDNMRRLYLPEKHRTCEEFHYLGHQKALNGIWITSFLHSRLSEQHDYSSLAPSPVRGCVGVGKEVSPSRLLFVTAAFDAGRF